MDFIFDVDGTVANLDHRVHFVKTKPKNWKAFEVGYVFDEPIPQTVAVLQALRAAGHKIIIVTARMGTVQGRADTLAWLEEHGIEFDSFYMRADNDFRSDDEVKQEILDQMIADGNKPFAVFDDRPGVVKMWRQNGIFVFDVNHREDDF